MILDYMDAYFIIEDQMPSCQAIADQFKVWPNAALEIIHRLVRKKILARNIVGKLKRGPKYYEAVSQAANNPNIITRRAINERTGSREYNPSP